ncbi:uncharacterized protein METZ01_LOCUS367097, partial [marine metagenome]
MPFNIFRNLSVWSTVSSTTWLSVNPDFTFESVDFFLSFAYISSAGLSSSPS